MNLPNKITIARILMIPLFLVALLSNIFDAAAGRYVALGIFILASLSDWLDGFLARRLNLITTFGKFMDPIADKLLVAAALIALVALGSIEAWMVIVLISREFIISGIRLVAAEQGRVIAASTWAKIKTAMQMILIIALLFSHESVTREYRILLTVCELLKWLSVAFTVISAWDYIYKNIDVFRGDKNKG
jgi:CDP-diacylglycerol--glycerol-3-phosphate 3-phosphatidyltransferase